MRDDEFARILADPAAAFANPELVLSRSGLSREQRLEILHRWEFDLRALEVAEEENMGGGEQASGEGGALLERVRAGLYVGELEVIGSTAGYRLTVTGKDLYFNHAQRGGK